MFEIPPFPLGRILLLVACSAFFSAAETSLFSLSRFHLRQWKGKNPKSFHQVRHLLDRPAALVATALLGNELANVFISHIMANYWETTALPSGWVTLLNLCTVVPLIVFFGEITPKVVAAKAPYGTGQFVVNPLWLFYKFSFPIRFLIENVVEILTRSLRKRHPVDDQIDEEDFLHLVEEGKHKGAIHSSEQELIENVFDLDDDRAMDLATPLQEFFTAKNEDTAGSVIERLKKNFTPRIPVLENGRVTGILYAKDLLNHLTKDQANVPVRQLAKPPLFVEPGMKAERGRRGKL
ncbi:MAG: DUF21 domain-containing protein [Bdellovibrionales bacterium]|nr:DUF21 domain-containing protein [Bdellovibrionales bacterium]